MRKGIHVLILALALAEAGLAQTTTGTVTGRVTDSSGASVPQATITLINTGTQLKLPTKTDEDGNYSFVAVQPAAYRLEAENTGFQKFATHFNLAVDQTVRVDVTLTVGQMTNTVEVSDKAALVESETSSLGQVISSKQVSDLPLNGRNPFALASLTPGVVPLGSFGVGLNATRSAAQMAGANNFMANGGIAGSNEVLLDGVPITVCCQGQPAIIPSVDV
ncbi:MAG: carboxypeptidase-like regulatory domain-containing protein, partial [Bryobacteraceae bacterium]